jgi:hypothetical protein
MCGGRDHDTQRTQQQACQEWDRDHECVAYTAHERLQMAGNHVRLVCVCA